ncbi:MAG: hypothetical protein AAGH88_15820 [Planctomycetota bacterium]
MHNSSSPPPTINPIDDTLIIGDAKIGKRCGGVSPHTAWRYRTKGRSGVRLPTIPWGRNHATSAAAIKWWFAQLQAIGSGTTPRPHRRAIDAQTEAECEALGI